MHYLYYCKHLTAKLHDVEVIKNELILYVLVYEKFFSFMKKLDRTKQTMLTPILVLFDLLLHVRSKQLRSC